MIICVSGLHWDASKIGWVDTLQPCGTKAPCMYVACPINVWYQLADMAADRAGRWDIRDHNTLLLKMFGEP